VTNRTGPGGVSGADLAAWNRASPVEAALAYAQRGWPVFPIASVDRRTGQCACQDGVDCEQIGKHPLVRWGDRASTDEDQIRDWWRWKPLANIGVATGQRSGLVVVDLDRHHDGLCTREELAERGLIFPPTVAARTRSGGWHFFYTTPPDRRVLNTEGELAGVGKTPGIDVRGDGGYIIMTPSIRPAPGPVGAGPRLRRYQWADRPTRLAPAPEWVTVPRRAPEPVHAGVPSTRARLPSAGRNLSARAQAAFDAEIRRVQHAGEGHRNPALFHAAANLFEIVNTGYLSEERVRGELTAASRTAGLGEREIRQTLDAQWRRKTGVRRDGWDPPPPLPVTITPSKSPRIHL
jgi:Bifunctional DNA primase/polymerase, N-terminal